MSSMLGGSLINELKVYGIVFGVLLCIDLPMILLINSQRYKTLFNNNVEINSIQHCQQASLTNARCIQLNTLIIIKK